MAVTLITPTAYARHRGCDEKAVRKAIAAARISTINGMVDPAVADIQWAQNTRARADSGPGRRVPAAVAQPGPSQTPSPAATSPAAAATSPGAAGATPTVIREIPPDEGEYSLNRARRERYEADLAELKLREQQGDLVRVVEVRAEIAKRVGQVRVNLLQIPARLAPLLTTETDQAKVHALLDAEIRAVLSSVATVD